MKAIYTIEGTGTHSLMKDLNLGTIFHCDASLDWSEYKKVYTTYRDPYLVGATWANKRCRANRPLTEHPRNCVETAWMNSWRNWSRNLHRMILYPTVELKSHENKTSDIMGVNKALKNEDFDYYYYYVPKYLIDFAFEQIEDIHG